jgi:hypothetical protein
VDVDEWGWSILLEHFPKVDGIPAFFQLDENGQSTGMWSPQISP